MTYQHKRAGWFSWLPIYHVTQKPCDFHFPDAKQSMKVKFYTKCQASCRQKNEKQTNHQLSLESISISRVCTL
jgi:hypothetical protein